MDATPRKAIKSPKALVNLSRPNKSTRTMEVKDMKAERLRPRMRDKVRKTGKLWQKGRESRQMPLESKDTLVTSKELIWNR